MKLKFKFISVKKVSKLDCIAGRCVGHLSNQNRYLYMKLKFKFISVKKVSKLDCIAGRYVGHLSNQNRYLYMKFNFTEIPQRTLPNTGYISSWSSFKTKQFSKRTVRQHLFLWKEILLQIYALIKLFIKS